MDAQETIFDKIVRKEIPATIIYEDDECLAFKDINPCAKFHAILIPKKKDGLDRLSNAEEKHKNILGHLMIKAGQIAKENDLEDGFRLVVNDGKTAGQTIWHLHLHIIGGQQLFWPPGTGKKEDIKL